VRYDARSFRVEKDKGLIGLATVAGRMKLPFTAHRQAHRWLDHADGFAQTCCDAPSGGCIWSLTSSPLNSFRVVASSGLIAVLTCGDIDCPISWAAKMEGD
jgi:hypothetical protein